MCSIDALKSSQDILVPDQTISNLVGSTKESSQLPPARG